MWRREVSVSFLEIHNDDIHDLLDQVARESVCVFMSESAPDRESEADRVRVREREREVESVCV